MIRYSAIFFLLISLFSCENQDEAQKRIRKASLLPEAIGEVSDILIVVDENLWLQGVKVKIENIFLFLRYQQIVNRVRVLDELGFALYLVVERNQ